MKKYEEIIDGFKASQLPKEKWTHEAHLVMAIHFAYQYLPENILTVARKKIKKLNDFHGTINSDHSGYHETLTFFWLKNAFTYFNQNLDLKADELTQRFVESENGSREYPLEFYSEKRLMSVKARKKYVEPDLKELEVDGPMLIAYHGHLTDDAFIDQFESCTLNANLFNHEAHLRLAWLYLDRFGLEEAEEKVSKGIQNYVQHLGALDKYHHTLTIAAVKTVYHFYQKNQGENFFDFIDEFPRIKIKFKSLIDAHYSQELLQSVQAKSDFIKPDLLEYS